MRCLLAEYPFWRRCPVKDRAE